ncbi:MAG: aldolase [Ruminococcaceae bacterium]|nr:aldolase [Oscillospiraceae bacterium]
MKLMLLTGDPVFAKKAEECGVDRIFLDLEYINKADRQKGRNTFITQNTVDDVLPLRKVLKKSELLVRVNPINPLLKSEIDAVCDAGADLIMLPMVYDAEDVKTFVNLVNGRAKTVPMIETTQAMSRIDDILAVDGVDELYIGLNDLHIGLGLTFMFEVLSGGLVDYMAEKIKAKGIPFGFGGMGKIGEGILPADRILAEHYRLGSSSVILSRTFRNEVDADGKPQLDLAKEIAKIRAEEEKLSKWTNEQFIENKLAVKKTVKQIVDRG